MLLSCAVSQPFAMGFIWMPNGTLTNGNEPASARFLIFNSFVLSLNVLFGTSGNLLVCCAVVRNRSLRTTNNALLLNLAAVALLKCSLDSPLFLASLIAGEKRFEIGLFMCCALQFTYSLFTCVQFLTLVLISIERYQAVAFPFKNRNERIRIWILCLWLCGFFFTTLSLTLCEDSASYMMCGHLKLEGSRTDPFGVYALISVWGFSLILIIIYYLRIFCIVRQHTNKITDTGVEFKASLERRHQPRSDRVGRSAPWTAPARSQNPGGAHESASFLPLDEFRSAGDHHADTRIAGAVCILTPAARELGRKRLEGRVAKRFGYIIITVILFWAPLLFTLFLNMSEDYSQNQRWLLCELETCALVLSCASAAVEPLIYALLHRQIRTQLYKLLPSRLKKNS